MHRWGSEKQTVKRFAEGHAAGAVTERGRVLPPRSLPQPQHFPAATHIWVYIFLYSFLACSALPKPPCSQGMALPAHHQQEREALKQMELGEPEGKRWGPFNHHCCSDSSQQTVSINNLAQDSSQGWPRRQHVLEYPRRKLLHPHTSIYTDTTLPNHSIPHVCSGMKAAPSHGSFCQAVTHCTVHYREMNSVPRRPGDRE